MTAGYRFSCGVVRMILCIVDTALLTTIGTTVRRDRRDEDLGARQTSAFQVGIQRGQL